MRPEVIFGVVLFGVACLVIGISGCRQFKKPKDKEPAGQRGDGWAKKSRKDAKKHYFSPGAWLCLCGALTLDETLGMQFDAPVPGERCKHCERMLATNKSAKQQERNAHLDSL